MEKGKRYYSNVCGHRYWYFTGETWRMQGYPDWGKVTRYVFEDVCGHMEAFTAEEFDKYFIEK